MGVVATVLTALVYHATAYPSVRRWQGINQQTLSEIKCTGSTCDTSVFTTDWRNEGFHYVIDKQTMYFLNFPASTEENPTRFAPLDFSDTAFVQKFRQSTSYNTPDGEVWRLYSRSGTLDG